MATLMSTVYLSISLPLLPDSEVSHTWIKIQSHQPNFDPCMGTGWLYRSLLNFCTTTLTDFPYWISTASPDQCILMAEKSARIPRLSGSDSPVHTACVNGETESKGLIYWLLYGQQETDLAQCSAMVNTAFSVYHCLMTAIFTAGSPHASPCTYTVTVVNSLVTASIQCTFVCVVQHTFLQVYVPLWICTHLRVHIHKINICQRRSTPVARMYRELKHRSMLHGHYGVNRVYKYKSLKEPLHKSNKEVAIADLPFWKC